MGFKPELKHVDYCYTNQTKLAKMSSPQKKMTAKQLKRQEKLAKKAKNMYTQEERHQKIQECQAQLLQLGLFRDYSEDTQYVYKLMDDYVETGIGGNGHCKITGTKRIFYYIFPQRRINEITTWLQYDENV